MTTLYLVISPNGNIAYAGVDREVAEGLRPAESADGSYVIWYGYELYTVEANTPWIEQREEKQAEAKAKAKSSELP